MNASRFPTLESRWSVRLTAFALGLLVALCGAQPRSLQGTDDTQGLVRKVCDNCGRTVNHAARRGQNCPHCGTFWTDERTLSPATPVDSRVSSAAFPPAHSRESIVLKPSSRKTWPTLPHRVQGLHQLIVDNHSTTDIWIALRDGCNGTDMKIQANGKGCLRLPEGTYRMYVFRCDQPTSLYEAANIKLGRRNVIHSTQKFCLWFDEVEPVERIDPTTGLHRVGAR